jgi:hypothetical protein
MAKKKRYHQSMADRRHEREGMMDMGRMDNEMGHGSRRYESEYRDGQSMKRMYDNSDPVPNTVRGLESREAYSGYKESRRMMARDGAMIREDMSAPALLPRNVIEEYWPKAANYNMGYVEDLFYGAQKQMHEDYDDLGRELGPKKY